MTAHVRRVTVLTSCTGRKASSPARLPAEELYRGQQHIRLMQGVRRLRDAGVAVDVQIVSAGHGVVHGDVPLAPYDRTFSGAPARDRRGMAERLGIPEAVRAAMATPADLGIMALGEEYLDVCRIDENFRPAPPTMLLCSASASLRLGAIADVDVVALRTQHTRDFRCGYVGLKGEVVGRLLTALAAGDLTVDDVLAGEFLAALSEFPPTSDGAATAANAIPLF